MLKKIVGAGFILPVLGIGTSGVGGMDTADTTNEEQYIQSLKQALDEGYTHFDTAERYGWGYAETLLGKAIKDTSREKLQITSKVWKTHLKHDDLLKAAKESLERLGTDYLDLYLVHAPNKDVPLKETMEAMNVLVDNGSVRNIGVSNFSKAQIKEAQQYSKAKIVANQVDYNLWSKACDMKTIQWCIDNDIMVMAYSPLQKMDHTNVPRVLQTIADKYKRTPAQVALQWLALKRGVVVLCKASSEEHMKENKQGLNDFLTHVEQEKLDALAQRPRSQVMYRRTRRMIGRYLAH